MLDATSLPDGDDRGSPSGEADAAPARTAAPSRSETALKRRSDGKPREASQPPQTPGSSHVRILLAEDTLDIQRVIVLLLKGAGATVTVADNGQAAVQEALEALRAERPFDLVLMDMQMPVMDGYEATLQLRREGYRGRIVALTAHAMVGDRQRCLAAGCDDYLAKPVGPSELAALVQRAAVDPPADRAMAASPSALSTVSDTDEVLRSEYANHPVVSQLLADFVGRLDERLLRFQAAIAEGQPKELQRLAHQLKGTAGSYGYPALSLAARRLEDEARRESMEAATQTVAEITSLCRAAIRGWQTR